MSRPQAQDDCWSFSLRSCNYQFEDSSSSDSDDSDPQPDGRLEPPKTEANLLQELDIGARNDTAVYKPNPWSIAKANASTRPRIPPQNSGNNSKKAATTNDRARPTSVIDMIRQQPSRLKTGSDAVTQIVQHNLPPQHDAPSVPSPPLLDSAHIPSDETLVDDLRSIHTSDKLSDFSPADVYDIASLPASPVTNSLTVLPLKARAELSEDTVSSAHRSGQLPSLTRGIVPQIQSAPAPAPAFEQDLRSLLFGPSKQDIDHPSAFQSSQRRPEDGRFAHGGDMRSGADSMYVLLRAA